MALFNSTLRLFKAIQVEDKTARLTTNLPIERMVRHGYLLDPAIPPYDKILNVIEKVVGLSGEQANASFHKSWAIVRDTSMETLIVQQIVHYITTYGFEALGIYNNDTVYIPKEQLDVPEVSLQDLPLVVIKAMTKDEILDKIIELGSGVALMQETLDDILTIIMTNKYDNNFVTQIGNRELRALLFELYGIVPNDPTEFLRYLITKITGESLVIKNANLIDKIKNADSEALDHLIEKAPSDLASIFFRFKPLFLAMKKISNNKRFFNQLRKKANKMHKPLPEDYLNNVTPHIKKKDLDFDKLAHKLDNANIFRKIRLANALLYRMQAIDAVVYRVRNGLGWATSFEWPKDVRFKTLNAFEIVRQSIVNDIRENVNKKIIYIPSWMHYKVPATEKQFTGNFPNGSSVAISGDTVVGIHWTDTDRRIDLDLSVIGESGKIGWDAAYRATDLKVLFSGDMTSAPKPNGASELFYFNGQLQESKIIMVNFYNFYNDEVMCSLLVAKEKVTKFDRNYMVDPNNILAKAQMNINKIQNIIGLIAPINGNNHVFFSNTSVGNSITSRVDDKSKQSRSYLINSMANSLDLRDLLIRAGANVVDEREVFWVPKEDYYDLSPEAIDKTSILNLLNK